MLVERIKAISIAQYTKAIDRGIREKWQQIKIEDTTPLVDNLKIKSIFKDKAKEGGDSVIDLVIEVL